MTRETFLKSWTDGLKQNIMRLTLKSELTEKEQKELNAYISQLERITKGDI